ncbi:MAG: dimethyl sulfoxide reductase anchor subunit [Alphaproteobacteria bacterium]|nr:dimethyl sulfoxide reductase anchor subunit [Alphaproteobacteria bacterium]
MHPALSVIVFTVASGAGYGLFALVALNVLVGLPFASPWQGLATLGTGAALAGFGLLASSAHLGRPERAWRGLTQWRSSWLSREGIAALVTFVPAALQAWIWLEGRPSRLAAIALLIGAVATVACTGMIYASLKPIRQWRHPLVVPNYGLMAMSSGALLACLFARCFGAPTATLTLVAGVALAAATACKITYWAAIDRGRAASTTVTATGLGAFDDVRLLDPPHTGSNYLLKEMGFRVARKHASKLRRGVLMLGFALPLAATLGATLTGGTAGVALAALAVGANVAGTVVERWLFFAEATHTVMLYYGTRSV